MHHPHLIEINARHAREEVARAVAATRPLPRPDAAPTRRGTARAARTRPFRALGLGLIALGERLAGPPAGTLCEPVG